ncbi:MAG: holo-ACP synthase [Atopobiaceae bacterium]|nr:holo-ACP synthase [Atopobiaceae bacterium]
MVIGIGTDVMRLSRIDPSTLQPGDPFFERAFTPAERAQAASRQDRHDFLVARFCAKEAVYKAVSDCREEFHPSDFEIVDDDDGHPHVLLGGRTAATVEGLWGPGVTALVSISHEDDLVSAFALAQIP